MKDIYELLNDVDIDENEFSEMEVDEVEKKIVKKYLKSSIKRKTNHMRKVAIVASLVFIIPTIFGVAFPTYAEKVPFLGDIFRYLNKRVEPIYENYKEYSTPINLTEESNGIKVTINEGIWDGETLYYTYTVESNRDLGEGPILGANSDSIQNIDGKYFGASGSSTLERAEGNTYVGQQKLTLAEYTSDNKDKIKFKLDFKDIAIVDGVFKQDISGDKVTISGDIREVVEGNWNFDIELDTVDNNLIVVDKNIKLEGIDLTIDKITLTPISTKVQFTEKVNKRRVNDWVFSYSSIDVEDDLGNKYVSEGNGAYGDRTSMHISYTFNKVDPKASKLIIKAKATGQEMVNGVWDENRKETEKYFEPVVIELNR